MELIAELMDILLRHPALAWIAVVIVVIFGSYFMLPRQSPYRKKAAPQEMSEEEARDAADYDAGVNAGVGPYYYLYEDFD